MMNIGLNINRNKLKINLFIITDVLNWLHRGRAESQTLNSELGIYLIVE
jgi:hypothetical protein